jgi:hypothetical protein
MLLYKKVSTSAVLHVNSCLVLKYFTVLKKHKKVSDITLFCACVSPVTTLQPDLSIT